MNNFIRQVRAHEGECVEIAWSCDDGTVFCQRITIPPLATRQGRNQAGQVIDRPDTNAACQRYMSPPTGSSRDGDR